ncbi:RING finger protein [Sporobolomyces salmoneus]|uniref:RING finger protein n=1 Tax=Sporobolomyces salmoneus TaxID=183962 RepID=UPI00317F6206
MESLQHHSSPSLFLPIDGSTSPTQPISTAETKHKEEDQEQYLPTPTSLPILSRFQFQGSSAPSLSPPAVSFDTAGSNSAIFAADGRPSVPGGRRVVTREDSVEIGEPRPQDERSRSEDGLPFEMEIEMDMDTQDANARVDPAADSASRTWTTTTDSPFSSSHRPFRTTRARYARSEPELEATSDSSQTPPPEPTQDNPVAPSHKRTFSYVSISTGHTPAPAFETRETVFASPPTSPSNSFPSLSLPLPSSSLSVDIAQHPLFRSTQSRIDVEPRPFQGSSRPRTHSFESQRASAVRASGRRPLTEVTHEGSDSSRPSSSLRQRRSEVERGGSKRRRASTILSGGDSEPTMPSTSTHQGSQSFAPALGRYLSQPSPIEPLLSRPSTSSATVNGPSRSLIGFGFVRGGGGVDRPSVPTIELPSTEARERSAALRHSFSRLPPWWRTTGGDHSAPPTVSASFVGPQASRFEALSTFSTAEYDHSDRSNRLHRRTDEILRQAEETLRSRQAILRDAEDTTRRARRLLDEDRTDRERERTITRLPDVGGLPEPAELSARPVIGLRIGEGWPATTLETSNQAQSPPPTGRRRRSSIFSTSHSPPASPNGEGSSDNLPMGGTSSRTRQFLTSLRSRRPRFSRNSTGIDPPELAPSTTTTTTTGDSTMFETSHYDEEAEHQAANELNDRLLERRRISASLEPPSRAGGGVESAALWGETLVRGFSTGSTLFPPRAPLATGFVTPVEGTATRGSTRQDPFRIDNNATDSSAISYFTRRSDSPSPQRRNASRGFRRTHTLGIEAGGSTSERSSFVAERTDEGLGDRNRPAIRLGFTGPSQPGPIAASSSSSRARLRFDDDDDEDLATSSGNNIARDRWNPPRLPLMLSSGSDGRRTINPPAGMSDSLEVAEEGGVAATSSGAEESSRWWSSFGPNHLAEDSSEHPRARSNPTNFFPFDELPVPITTTSTADAFAIRPSVPTSDTRPASSSNPLNDVLSLGREERSNQTLRRRHTALDDPTPSRPVGRTSQEAVDAVADRLAQHRVERLASLRRERNFMRTLLGGSDPNPAEPGTSQATRSLARNSSQEPAREEERRSSEAEAQPASPPRSPGFRRRALGDFFRGFGTGGRLMSIFDDDYGAFFGRDAVALDSRNYLEDDEFDASYEGLLRLSAQIGDAKPKGVSQDAIARLRTFPYSQWPYIERSSKEGKNTDPIPSTSAKTIEGETKPEFARKNIEKEARCAICLCDYEEDDSCSLANCLHGFHTECLKSWFSTTGSCPVCRQDHT